MHAVYTEDLSRKEKREHWKQLISDYRSSHLKQSEFARIHGLKSRDLSRWQRRLKKLSVKDKAMWCKSPSETDPGINFVAVEMLSNKDASTSTLVLCHVSGFSLKIDSDSDEAILRKVLKILLEVTR